IEAADIRHTRANKNLERIANGKPIGGDVPGLFEIVLAGDALFFRIGQGEDLPGLIVRFRRRTIWNSMLAEIGCVDIPATAGEGAAGTLVVKQRQPHLFEVVEALRASSSLAGRLDCGQQQGDENSDDRDDDQQLHERERASGAAAASFRSVTQTIHVSRYS